MVAADQVASGLSEEDREVLDRVISHLDLLADLSHADLLLFGRAGEEAVVLAQSQPVPVPSLYPPGLEGQRVGRAQASAVHRVLFAPQPRRVTQGTMVRGAPTLQELFPIVNARGQTIAVLSSEMALLEHERQRKKSAVLRRAIARVRELVLTGRLRGGELLGRLGPHDGVMVIDAQGQIQYISAVAEYFYRRLGYADSLLKTQLQELDTNEYICFKAMERGICLEQKIEEQGLIWIKRVIPLLTTPADVPLIRFGRRPNEVIGAIVVVQDITEELQKEQELRIKSAMIREIHHRVKNNLQTIAALLRLQARRTGSPEVGGMLQQSIHRILSIAVVHEFLSQEETSVVNLYDVGTRIVTEAAQGILDPDKRVRLSLEGEKELLLPAQQATSGALILNELLQNALEHGFADRGEGTITVRLGAERDSMFIEVRDDGRGLPPGFDPAVDGGLGLQIVQTLVREDLKGQLVLENGGGVRALVSFPRWQLAEQADRW